MALSFIAGGVGIAFLDLSVAGDEFVGLGSVLGGATIFFGLILLVIAYGFLKGWAIMWYLGVIFAAIGAIGSLIALPAGIVTLVINLVILYYLFRPQVKRFFKI